MLMGQVLTGELWNLTIYGKGLQHRIFLDNGPIDSERILVFKFHLCPGPLVLWGREEVRFGS